MKMSKLVIAVLMLTLFSSVNGSAPANVSATGVLTIPMMKLGVELLQTHLFVFYYAVLSAITPPVALAVFAAAAIAKCSPIALAGNALRLSIVAFFLPLAWVYHPEINLQDVSSANLLPTVSYILALLVATIGVAAGHIGYLKTRISWVGRLLLLLSGGMILSQSFTIILAGVSMIVVLLGMNIMRSRRVLQAAEKVSCY